MQPWLKPISMWWPPSVDLEDGGWDCLAPHGSPCPMADISCPPRSHYELCSQACSQTCSTIHMSGRCSMKTQCREGCVCDQGFVLSGGDCVPMSQCGCHHQDFYYKANETFYPSKQEKCHCQAGGHVDCQKTSCPGDGEGEVIDGVFQCPSTAPGTCVATGDRNYVSFDGVAFNISGTCSYVLTETCSGDLDSFVVKIQKDARQKKKVSSIQALTIEVHGLTLTLMQGRRSVLVRWCLEVHHMKVVVVRSRGSCWLWGGVGWAQLHDGGPPSSSMGPY